MNYSIDSHTYVSPNYSSRPAGVAVDSIVIHTTEGNFDSDAVYLCTPSSQVSCHYVIPPAGAIIYQLVSESKVAWHAGNSSYNGRSNWNNFSIGIEISHKAGQTWPFGQKDLTAALCTTLIDRYRIPSANIAAHRWVATPAGRKSDPTDWPDTEFRAWIDSLYPSPIVRYTVVAPCAVFTDRRPDAPLASGFQNGQTQLQTGMQINVGDVTDGWLWVSDGPQTQPGIGFIPQSYARPA